MTPAELVNCSATFWSVVFAGISPVSEWTAGIFFAILLFWLDGIGVKTLIGLKCEER